MQEQPLVMSVIAFDTEVRRVMIDRGEGWNVMFYNCFKAMGLTDAHLTPTHVKLEGFTTHLIAAKGMIELKGERPKPRE